MPDLHASNRRWMVHYRDPAGKVKGSHNATAWVGEDQYEQRIAVLAADLSDGWTLDTTEADEAHRRTQIARRRYAAAMNRFLLSSIGSGDYRHPGDVAEWMPAERNVT